MGTCSASIPKGRTSRRIGWRSIQGWSVRDPLKAPAGYKVPPHTHPNDENVTVISGTFNIGMGGTFDEKNGQALKVGGFVHMPKGMQHFAWSTDETIIQLHGMGPQGIIYVNPADDPRKSN
jgi:anti-sigma factor ChrR (cupin superfamily)